MAEVALSSGMRSNLTSLQRSSKQLGSVQERLATGKRVNSAIDSPTNFFAAANLNDRADKLSSRLDGMGQAISVLSAADNSINAMRGILSAMKGLVDEALSQSDSNDRAASGRQFNELIVQLGDFAKDGSYKGVNLLKSAQSDRASGGAESLTVQFNESFGESTLSIEGINIQGSTAAGTSGLAVDSNGEIANSSDIISSRLTTGATAGEESLQQYAITYNAESDDINASASAADTQEVKGLRSAEITTSATSASDPTNHGGSGHTLSWISAEHYQSNLQSMVSDLESFDSALVNTAKSLSQNVNIVSIRQEFTGNLINALEEGADKLTLADLNEEGANLLALQTAQQLGIQSLSLASQTNQGVLSLIG